MKKHIKSGAELCSIVDGQSVGSLEEVQFSGVEFDSRKIQEGNLFVAYQGENTHGHNFLDSAFENGASLALIEDPELLQTSPHKEKLVCVPDTVKGLNDLATQIRKESEVPTLAITGSMGKTTVKALARTILEGYGKGTASVGSYNNHIGVAYTIINSSPDDKGLVLEMGMNHAGELSLLTHIGQPDVAMITCIAPVHIEFFDGIEGIAQAKLEILEGIVPGGKLILNGDDPVLMSEYIKWCERNESSHFQTLTYSEKEKAELAVSDISSKGFEGYVFTATTGSESISIELPLLGRHNVFNTSAAVLACKTLLPDLPAETIQKTLLGFSPEKHRLNVSELPEGRTLIDDSYNSNPTALKAALQLLHELAGGDKKTGVIIGDMTETGDLSPSLHKEVGEYLLTVPPGFVLTVGEASKSITEIASNAGIEALHCDTPEEAGEVASKKEFELLLVKASRSVGLDRSVAVVKGA